MKGSPALAETKSNTSELGPKKAHTENKILTNYSNSPGKYGLIKRYQWCSSKVATIAHNGWSIYRCSFLYSTTDLLSKSKLP